MNYKEKTGSYESKSNESTIYYRICTPSTDHAKGIIQIITGMCEYFDRYEETIEHFTSKGFIVCGNDHLGHGKSAETNDNLGYFGKGKEVYHNLADDAYTLNQLMKKTYKSLPYIMFGHSMGSFVIRDYMARYPESIDGAVVCGTSGTNKAVDMGIALSTISRTILGDKHRSTMIANISFAGYNSHYKEEKDNLSWLTRVKEVREKYAKDPFCNYTFTANAYNNMFKLLKWVSSDEWYDKVPLSLPVFLIAGTEDPVGAYGEGPKEVHERLSQRELNFLKLKLYKGARHELFNETIKEEVWSDVEAFADEVIDGVLEARGYGKEN